MHRDFDKTYTGRHELATPPAQLPCGSRNRLRDSGKDLHGTARNSLIRCLLSANAQFSGRATTCHARRGRTMATPRSRRARDWVSRSAATACYVRLPPNLPKRAPFGLRWTLLRALRRTKGTALHGADELDGLPSRQRRYRGHLTKRSRARPMAENFSCSSALLCTCEPRSRRGNEDSTERSEAADTRTRATQRRSTIAFQRDPARRSAA